MCLHPHQRQLRRQTSPRRTSVDSRLSQQEPPQLYSPPAAHSNIPSSANLMFTVTPANYEGDATKIMSSACLNIAQIPGDSVSPHIPPCPYEKVLFAPTSSPDEVSLFHRRKTSLPQKILRCPPARLPDQIQHYLRIHPTVCMVKLVIFVLSFVVDLLLQIVQATTLFSCLDGTILLSL